MNKPDYATEKHWCDEHDMPKFKSAIGNFVCVFCLKED